MILYVFSFLLVYLEAKEIGAKRFFLYLAAKEIGAKILMVFSTFFPEVW